MYPSIKNVKYVDANLDAPDNAISDNESSSRCLQAKVKYRNELKTGNAKE